MSDLVSCPLTIDWSSLFKPATSKMAPNRAAQILGALPANREGRCVTAVADDHAGDLRSR